MTNKKSLFLGIVSCFLIAGTVFAETFTSFSDTQTKQEQNFSTKGEYLIIEKKGEWRSDKIVKWNGYGKKEQHAYAIVQETETQIISTGYGDKELSKELTFIYEKPILETPKPSSTIRE